MNRQELQKIAVNLGKSEIIRNIKKESEKLRRTDQGMVRVADLIDQVVDELNSNDKEVEI